jgi:hypothetical protein
MRFLSIGGGIAVGFLGVGGIDVARTMLRYSQTVTTNARHAGEGEIANGSDDADTITEKSDCYADVMP